jgi:hypothetical protein
MEAGDFIEMPPPFVREAILGVLGRTLTRYSGGQAPFDPTLADRVAVFVLRALLIDTSAIDDIRRQAHTA